MADGALEMVPDGMHILRLSSAAGWPVIMYSVRLIPSLARSLALLGVIIVIMPFASACDAHAPAPAMLRRR